MAEKSEISTEKLKRKIKEILKDADLSELSTKKVRLKLQSYFEIDLSNRKKEIDKMTMDLIMEMEEKNKEVDSDESEKEQNGKHKSDSESDMEKEPPKKKTKLKHSSAKSKTHSKEKSKKSKEQTSSEGTVKLAPLENDDLNAYDEEQKTLKLSDEELAKRLQQFEDTGRRTRNKAPAKKREKKKGGKMTMKEYHNNSIAISIMKKIDIALANCIYTPLLGGGNSAYSRPCFLSPELAAVMGTDKLARNEVVKKMWEIVKERKLQDPKDKRFMLCDEQLAKVFGRKRLQTFGMMKYLASHIKDESSSLEYAMTNTDIYDDEAEDD